MIVNNFLRRIIIDSTTNLLVSFGHYDFRLVFNTIKDFFLNNDYIELKKKTKGWLIICNERVWINASVSFATTN